MRTDDLRMKILNLVRWTALAAVSMAIAAFALHDGEFYAFLAAMVTLLSSAGGVVVVWRLVRRDLDNLDDE